MDLVTWAGRHIRRIPVVGNTPWIVYPILAVLTAGVLLGAVAGAVSFFTSRPTWEVAKGWWPSWGDFCGAVPWIALAISVGTMAALVFLWPKPCPDAPKDSPTPTKQRTGWQLRQDEVGPIVSEGIAWKWTGGRSTAGPVVRPYCPEHMVALMFEVNRTNELGDLDSSSMVGEADYRQGALFCGAGGQHRLYFDRVPREYAQARSIAMRLMEAKMFETIAE